MLDFCGERKTGKSREKPSEQGENQQETQPTYGTGPNFAIGREEKKKKQRLGYKFLDMA